MSAIHDKLLQDDTAQKPENDRFSLVIMANYSQWDTPSTSMTLRSGKLVAAQEGPYVRQNMRLLTGVRTQLNLDWNNGKPGDLFIVNESKYSLDPKELPPYVAVFKGDDTVPFSRMFMNRVNLVDPTMPISVLAIGQAAVLSYYFFPS